MKQTSLGLNLSVMKTRNQVFLQEMEQIVPWQALVDLIAPYYPEGQKGRPPFALGICQHSCPLFQAAFGIFSVVGFSLSRSGLSHT